MKVIEIKANIDDMSGELLSLVAQKLLSAGALDAILIPCTMKKGRAGTLLQVLTRVEDREKISALILRETSSIGLRYREMERTELERETREVEVTHNGRAGKCRVKIARLGSEILNVKPEADDLIELSETLGLTIRETSRLVSESL